MSHNIQNKAKEIFLSSFERKSLLLIALNNDKGTHTSNIDQTLAIIWKIIGEGL